MNKKTKHGKTGKINIFKVLPESMRLSIPMIVLGFSEVLFLLLVLALDVLPAKYVLTIVALILIGDAIIVFLMNSRSKHGTRRIVALVVIVFVVNALLIGDYYVYSTYDTLQKISAQRDTWEYYDVVTLKNGSYQSVKDIKGQDVKVVDMESRQLNEASERLITKADVNISKVNGLMALGQVLVEDDDAADDEDVVGESTVDENEIAKAAEKVEADEAKETENTKAKETTEVDESDLHDEIILVSNSGYDLIKSNIEGFKKNTQVIYKIKVKKRADDNSKAVDVTKDAFNVLISGIDQWGTIDEEGLSDVNMIMTVNPTTREILLTSIPRDSYIPLHSYGANDKLTHSGIYGAEETKQTIEDFLDIDINYTIRLNFSMLVDVIDAMGGLDIYSEYDFHSAIANHVYHKGWQHLSGKGCLYFARERKAFENGDMQRNKNQQIVLKAALKKATNSKVILTSYTKMLNAVEDEMSTDLRYKDIGKLVKMQLNDMRKWDIETVNITGATGGAPCFSMGGQNLSCVFPSEESVNEAKEAIHDTMYPAEDAENEKNKDQGNE